MRHSSAQSGDVVPRVRGPCAAAGRSPCPAHPPSHPCNWSRTGAPAVLVEGHTPRRLAGHARRSMDASHAPLRLRGAAAPDAPDPRACLIHASAAAFSPARYRPRHDMRCPRNPHQPRLDPRAPQRTVGCRRPRRRDLLVGRPLHEQHGWLAATEVPPRTVTPPLFMVPLRSAQW
jgi:hypothetical protein